MKTWKAEFSFARIMNFCSTFCEAILKHLLLQIVQLYNLYKLNIIYTKKVFIYFSGCFSEY